MPLLDTQRGYRREAKTMEQTGKPAGADERWSDPEGIARKANSDICDPGETRPETATPETSILETNCPEDADSPDPCPHCGGTGRTKSRTEEEMRRLLNRLTRIEGQIRGIRGMVERDAYCVDVLIQTAAANAALTSFSRELLASHIRTCVADNIRAGRDESIEELIGILQKMMR